MSDCYVRLKLQDCFSGIDNFEMVMRPVSHGYFELYIYSGFFKDRHNSVALSKDDAVKLANAILDFHGVER